MQRSRELILVLVLFIATLLICHTLYQFVGNRELWLFNVTLSSEKSFYPCIAVIVEFRATNQLFAVVHNVNNHIPSTWPIQIFHGKDNEQFIRNSTLAPLIRTGKITLDFMDEVYGKNRTSELLTNPQFWRRVRGEKVLFFQIDSIMCSNSPHRVTDYLQYDYVGAPWTRAILPFDTEYRVGNGGFSLRTRSKVLALLALLKHSPGIPEDLWYAQNMRHVNGSIPSIEVAKTFAVESIPYERPVGIHRTTLPCAVREKLFQTCPEAMLVMTGKCQ